MSIAAAHSTRGASEHFINYMNYLALLCFVSSIVLIRTLGCCGFHLAAAAIHGLFTFSLSLSFSQTSSTSRFVHRLHPSPPPPPPLSLSLSQNKVQLHGLFTVSPSLSFSLTKFNFTSKPAAVLSGWRPTDYSKPFPYVSFWLILF